MVLGLCFGGRGFSLPPSFPPAFSPSLALVCHVPSINLPPSSRPVATDTMTATHRPHPSLPPSLPLSLPQANGRGYWETSEENLDILRELYEEVEDRIEGLA